MRPGATLVLIPNTTVKPRTADGPALETMWESRWAPRFKKKVTVPAQTALRLSRLLRNPDKRWYCIGDDVGEQVVAGIMGV